VKTKRAFAIVYLALLVVLATGVHAAFASSTNGTIPAGSYAWGENIGWINFGCANCGIQVTDSAVTGNAWSAQYGWINLSPTNGGVTNDSNGNLGGDAWSSGLGWINFSGVVINASGQFTGTAGTQGSTAGRLNFSCANCNVTTDWRPASVRNQSSNSNSSGGSLLGGFFNFFSGGSSGNVTATNATNTATNTVNNTNPGSIHPGVSGANPNKGPNFGTSIVTAPAYPIATSTALSRPGASKTDAPNQPLAKAVSNHSNKLPLIVISCGILFLLVILTLRFL